MKIYLLDDHMQVIHSREFDPELNNGFIPDIVIYKGKYYKGLPFDFNATSFEFIIANEFALDEIAEEKKVIDNGVSLKDMIPHIETETIDQSSK